MRGNTGYVPKKVMTKAQGRLALSAVITGCTDKALASHIANPWPLVRSYAGVTVEQVQDALEAEREGRAAR